MQLRDDHPFGAIDDEGAVIGHQRQFAHVDFVSLMSLILWVPASASLSISTSRSRTPQRRV